ncbi:T9SS type A sorting domain-containing protein [Flavivirga spongiicola]|uniref:T9SS type A sorting domain-containing protein n=1 Tax=Flavivirga spongiicola TaxID=421621 RepID=A0ABU7XQI6_9FLAO|nr:T9SS type A sorting domain-containing protein [Flavivirga sp. MEBiC05379]MDO5977713.1 T9SS type A sorting domain-containing protein [Flavivirga sp. MEBiC05379]
MRTNYCFLLIVFTILFFSFSVSGQTLKPLSSSNNSEKEIPEVKDNAINPDFCGTDFFHNKKMKNDAQYKARHKQTIQSIQRVGNQQKRSVNGIMQVPVVVHVMHKGEAVGTGTNISDEDVRRGIKYLNNYWRKIADSKGNGDGVDMKIEFALAIQDESGNCTNGIDRVDMSGVPAYVSDGVNSEESGGIDDYSSGGGVNSLKEYSIWNPTKYYNVWIVDEIDNNNCYSGGSYTGGYAYFASAHGRPYDGSVVLICSYLNESSSTWAHEMGHAFNLPHTFNGDDPDTNTCGDDGITDTPEHVRTSGIDPSIYRDCDNNDANTCDPTFNQVTNPDTGFRRNTGTHQDHMHNYMDYTGCATEFTGGQRAVARDALNGRRASFLTSPALTPPATATVDFISEGTSICLGSTLAFTDVSTCTPNSYTNEGYDDVTFLWTFDNGVDTPYTSTDQNPTITFNNLGTYGVTLSVTNPQGRKSLTKADHIIVSSATVTGACTISSTNNDGNFNNGVTNISFNTLNNMTTTFIPDNALQDFICIKSTAVNVGTTYDLNVNYKSRPGGGQYLEVWIDWDNSGSFDTSNSNGINEKVLADNIAENSSGQPSVSVTPPDTAVRNTILRMRVISEYDKSPVMCGNGRAQRADDYGVYVSNGILSTTDLSKSDNRFKIIPNPVQDYLNISLDNNEAIRAYQIYDISGKEIMSNLKMTKNSIEVSGLSNGFYFLKIKTDTKEMTSKFIKK